MQRTLDINDPKALNPWIKRSIDLFSKTHYLDNIRDIYPFQVSIPQRINRKVRREIIQAHQSRNTERLLDLLESQTKFPYEDPMWYLLKTREIVWQTVQSKSKELLILYIL